MSLSSPTAEPRLDTPPVSSAAGIEPRFEVELAEIVALATVRGSGPTRPDARLGEVERWAAGLVATVRDLLVSDQPAECALGQRDAELGRELEGAAKALRDLLPSLGALSRRQRGATCELLVEINALNRELREHELAGRLAALVRVDDALAGLRELSDPARLIDASAAVLCGCCGVARALVSRICGSSWVIEQTYPPELGLPSLPDTVVPLKGRALPLSSSPMEMEVLRRKRPLLVSGSECEPSHPLAGRRQGTGYIAAPIIAGRRVIGFLHGDMDGSRQVLNAAHRDSLAAFADGFGVLFERSVMLARLTQRRLRTTATFGAMNARLDELADGDLRFARDEPNAAGRSSSPQLAGAPEPRINRLLTAREREVVELMVAGETNGGIARLLVISEATAKSHVKNILRKLRATNRTEAVARYLTLTAATRRSRVAPPQIADRRSV